MTESSKSGRMRAIPPVMSYGLSAVISFAVVLVVAFGGRAEAVSQDLDPAPLDTGKFVAEDLVRELGSELETRDRALPSLLVPGTVGDGGLSVDTVRFAGASDDRMVWLGQDAAGNVCAVLHTPVEDITSTACSSPEFFATHGLGISVRGIAAESYAEAYVIPDGESVRLSAESGLSEVSPNVFVGDTRNAGSSTGQVFGFSDDTPVRISLTQITDEEMKAEE